MFDCRWETGGRQSTKLTKRKGCHGTSGSLCRRLEGLKYRAHTERVVFSRKRKEQEGEGKNRIEEIVQRLWIWW